MARQIEEQSVVKVDKYTYVVSSNFREEDAPTITELMTRVIEKQVNRRLARAESQ